MTCLRDPTDTGNPVPLRRKSLSRVTDAKSLALRSENFDGVVTGESGSFGRLSRTTKDDDEGDS